MNVRKVSKVVVHFTDGSIEEIGSWGFPAVPAWPLPFQPIGAPWCGQTPQPDNWSDIAKAHNQTVAK